MKPVRLLAALLATAPLAALDAPSVALRGGRIVPVDGPVIEAGTIVLAGGKIAALGKDVTIPVGAQVVDATGKTVYPGLIDALTTLGLTEIGSVAGSNDISEVGDVNPHAKAWVAVHAHSELIPVARANGVTAALAAPEGGLISGQSALIRLAGSTPESLTVRGPVAMHMVYPSGNPAFRLQPDLRGAGEEDFRGAPGREEEEPGEGSEASARPARGGQGLRRRPRSGQGRQDPGAQARLADGGAGAGGPRCAARDHGGR